MEQAERKDFRKPDEVREFPQGRVELMKDYAETKDCRRRYLMNYFGEAVDGPCGRCDVCDAGTVSHDQSQPAGQLRGELHDRRGGHIRGGLDAGSRPA